MHTLKAGPILVAISPFKKVPMYGNNYIEAYKRKITKSPHVYAITNTTIREMIRDEVNQSIIIREANTTSVPVARPIWMEFPSDEATFSSDEAFMRAKHASVYLPEKQSWYDLRTEAGDTIGILSIGLTYVSSKELFLVVS
ncbi:probable glucan 1,3-alpha-glucosidase isoform X2 [Vicia villosa]|uniref:probable glucan 1,3-alpha-glucosidase isoform X2 n=1 Tax=Vicia villosa TaxID=3911 RepID=UPI00273B7FAC|nr:probable glucan 1,3-alpha-glucosidase isoform X2 [Vicia villosa]